jgi:type II secretory pathway component PulK
MKLSSPSARRGKQGMAVLVVLVLLAILMLYITANVRSLHIMSQEIKLVEQRQLRHWSSGAAVPAVTVPPTVPVGVTPPP